MSDNNKFIHEFDFNLICEYFSSVERQGPGSSEVTIKALGFCVGLTDESLIADIGCGTGGQTMVLGMNTPAKIVGYDLFPLFIEKFNQNASDYGFGDRVVGKVGSMEQLPFSDGELDVIWSEGAIYNIGFEHGINEWRKFLKPGGYLAVSEASWFTEHRPPEIHSYWKNAYPEIDTIPNKVYQMQKAGYIPVATFVLPENCWTKNFYEPQINAQEVFLAKYPQNKTAQELVIEQRREAYLYSEYKSYYGYVFYIGKKI